MKVNKTVGSIMIGLNIMNLNWTKSSVFVAFIPKKGSGKKK